MASVAAILVFLFEASSAMVGAASLRSSGGGGVLAGREPMAATEAGAARCYFIDPALVSASMRHRGKSSRTQEITT
jgi:hypothetical protein